jgi:hypothetical protein
MNLPINSLAQKCVHMCVHTHCVASAITFITYCHAHGLWFGVPESKSVRLLACAAAHSEAKYYTSWLWVERQHGVDTRGL